MRFLARLEAAHLSHEENMRMMAHILNSTLPARRALDIFLSAHCPLPDWAVHGILNNDDLLTNIVGTLERRDFHAALVSQAWLLAWNACASNRAWLHELEVNDVRLDDHHIGWNNTSVHPTGDWLVCSRGATLKLSWCGQNRTYTRVVDFDHNITATLVTEKCIYIALASASFQERPFTSVIMCFAVGDTAMEVVETLESMECNDLVATFKDPRVRGMAVCTHIVDGGNGFIYAANHIISSSGMRTYGGAGSEILKITAWTGDCVLILDTAFGGGQFCSICLEGMVIVEQRLYVGDPKNWDIQVFSLDGIWMHGLLGVGGHQLPRGTNSPWRATKQLLHHRGRLYLVDGDVHSSNGDSVKVISLQGVVLQVWRPQPPRTGSSDVTINQDVTEVRLMCIHRICHVWKLVVQTTIAPARTLNHFYGIHTFPQGPATFDERTSLLELVGI
jgi:hypothetical protein